MPLISGLARIVLKKGSTVRIKMIGESGHLCRFPLHIEKGSDIVSFLLTLALGHEYRLVIQFFIPFLSPICCSVALRNVQSTLSNAFSASVDISTKGF